MSDLIRREDAIKAVAEVLSLNRFASFKNIKDFGRFAERMLRNVPSADRPQGKWIFDPEILCSDIGVYSAGYRCSVCGKDYFKVEGMNYCPSCGARMKGADDGSR